MSYNVAFVYTHHAGGYEGVVTWTPWASKDEFEADKAGWPDERKLKQRVLEEGISKERCEELVDQTPAACRMASAVQEARREDGSVDSGILQMTMGNAMFAISEARARG